MVSQTAPGQASIGIEGLESNSTFSSDLHEPYSYMSGTAVDAVVFLLKNVNISLAPVILHDQQQYKQGPVGFVTRFVKLAHIYHCIMICVHTLIHLLRLSTHPDKMGMGLDQFWQVHGRPPGLVFARTNLR